MKSDDASRTPSLTESHYPFFEDVHPVGEMRFVECPEELETFLLRETQAQGVVLRHDAVIELTCRSPNFTGSFVIYRPSGSLKLNLLVPIALVGSLGKVN